MGVSAASDLNIRVFTDFDGTISDSDSLKLLLERFGDPRWKLWEAKIHKGEMSEREALSKMFQAFPLSLREAQDFVLKNVKLDPHFTGFVNWCQSEGIEIDILSGGFQELISPLLARQNMADLSLMANSAQEHQDQEQGWRISPARVDPLCSLCTHCKSASLLSAQTHSTQPTLLIYVGDGHTDYCAQQLAHLVFAKGALLNYCGDQAIEFSTFADVRHSLETFLEASSHPEEVWGWRASEFMKSLTLAPRRAVAA